jgi:hypothetical protein
MLISVSFFIQHLFSAVTDSLFANDTMGWSLGTDSVTVDLASSLTADQLNQIEQSCNDFIRRGASVEWKLYSKSDLANKEDDDLALMRGGVKGAALELEELRLVRNLIVVFVVPKIGLEIRNTDCEATYCLTSCLMILISIYFHIKLHFPLIRFALRVLT